MSSRPHHDVILLTWEVTEHFTGLFAPLAVERLSFPPMDSAWLFHALIAIPWLH